MAFFNKKMTLCGFCKRVLLLIGCDKWKLCRDTSYSGFCIESGFGSYGYAVIGNDMLSSVQSKSTNHINNNSHSEFSDIRFRFKGVAPVRDPKEIFQTLCQLYQF